MSNFKKLGLSESTLAVLEQIGFENPTPVQEQAIPLLLKNDPTDFIGLAQTGTGKTAAFGLPLIDLIDINSKETQALIMAPTRELGQQTAKQLVDFSQKNKMLNIEVVYGGAAITNQIRALKKPTQIIVATPGRLLDLINRKAVKLNSVRYVVLDEADEMLNMGFKEDIDKILSFTQKDRVTWLFSATMPSEIRRIVTKYMQNPLEVSINDKEKVNKDIAHQFVMTKSSNRVPALRRFLDIQPDMKGIMFCRTKREAQEIADDLGNVGYNVEALHGDLSQAQRDAVMRRFKNRAMQLLIATDVAARGIDVNDLTHVFHHSLPDQIESYTHRSGRTARAGKKGISLAFINPREGRRITELERKYKVKFEQVEVPSAESLKENRIKSWAKGLVKAKVHKEAENILESLEKEFTDLSKEDILLRLLSSQLEQISTNSGENDLNEVEGGAPGRRNKAGFNRYFINLGEIDGFKKVDLLQFISDASGIESKFIGDISLQKNCAYFDVDNKKDKGLNTKFQGIEVEGREVRVNRDEEKGGRDGRERGGRGSSNRNRSGGGENRGGGNRRDKFGGARSGGGGTGKRPRKDFRGDRNKRR